MSGSHERSIPRRVFVEAMTVPVWQAAAAVRWLEGRVANRPKLEEFTPEKATLDSLTRYTNMDKQFVTLEMKKLNAIGMVRNDNTVGLENDFYSAAAAPLNELIKRLDPVINENDENS